MEKEEDKYMDQYAQSLAGQGQKISPEDSDYKEKLIHVVQSFRTFDVALDDFILHHGYTGELSDINTFIETMEEFGDIWTVEQVKDVYSKKTLEEAIADRQSSHAKFADIIRTVINR